MSESDDFEKLMWSMLKDKGQILKVLIDDIGHSQTQINGLTKFMENSKNWDIEDLQQKLPVAFKVMKKQSITIRAMLAVLMVYVSGGEFDTDVAQVLNKMGHGQEAMREILRQKMRD